MRAQELKGDIGPRNLIARVFIARVFYADPWQAIAAGAVPDAALIQR
jgi:hypothetical protein